MQPPLKHVCGVNLDRLLKRDRTVFICRRGNTWPLASKLPDLAERGDDNEEAGTDNRDDPLDIAHGVAVRSLQVQCRQQDGSRDDVRLALTHDPTNGRDSMATK